MILYGAFALAVLISLTILGPDALYFVAGVSPVVPALVGLHNAAQVHERLRLMATPRAPRGWRGIM